MRATHRREGIMRKSIMLFAIVAFTALFLSDIALAQDEEENKPSIYINELVHNLGTVFEKKTYRHVFKVENRGKADLIIEKVKPG